MARTAALKHDPMGPTPERLARAEGDVSIGDDQQGGRRYSFMDNPLDRLYSRLAKASKTEDSINRLRIEYAALTRYQRLFVESGMVGSIGSVDPNRTYSPTPFNRTFLAGSEKQCNDREDYRRAQIRLGHVPGIVVDNVVCHGNSLEKAGYCVGKNTPGWAHDYAQKTLRDAGFRLAVMWGMARGT